MGRGGKSSGQHPAAGADLSTAVGCVELASPVIAASGTCGTGVELARASDVRRLGAVVMKTVTREPRSGNPPVRIAETPSGMLNAIGLENPGVERFCERLLPESRGLGVPLVASVAGNSPSDYAECARVIEEAGGVVAVEVNLSCPNDRDAAARRTPLAFGQDPRAAAEVVGAVVASCALPVWAKLTSSVADIASVARGCVEAGADAVVAVNTIPAMAIDLRARRPVLSAVTGGLSGPAIRPVALRCAWEVSRAVGCAVVACGGIESAEDALAAVLAGASAVEVGTATFRDPRAAERIVGELPSLLEEVTREGERCSVRSLVGRLEC